MFCPRAEANDSQSFSKIIDAGRTDVTCCALILMAVHFRIAQREARFKDKDLEEQRLIVEHWAHLKCGTAR